VSRVHIQRPQGSGRRAIWVAAFGAGAFATPNLHRAIAGTLPGTQRVERAGDSLAVNKAEYQGWKTYHTYCDRCHGQDAMGSTIAPNLRRSVGADGSVTHNVFIQRVADGVADKGMPAWKGILSPEQMEDLWAYIRARSSGRLAPGRPHMASGGKTDSAS
jgi:mono/diheme cytochrome c family protein